MNIIKNLMQQLIAVFGEVKSLVKYERMPSRINSIKHYNIRDGF